MLCVYVCVGESVPPNYRAVAREVGRMSLVPADSAFLKLSQRQVFFSVRGDFQKTGVFLSRGRFLGQNIHSARRLVKGGSVGHHDDEAQAAAASKV